MAGLSLPVVELTLFPCDGYVPLTLRGPHCACVGISESQMVPKLTSFLARPLCCPGIRSMWTSPGHPCSPCISAPAARAPRPWEMLKSRWAVQDIQDDEVEWDPP